jgi:hypothetical protein
LKKIIDKMPDISMCNNRSCPSSKYCYRFTATPTEYRQSYANFSVEKDEINCDHFWPNGVDSIKCDNVHSEGNTCSSNDCQYPKCIDDTYCKSCGQINGVHKMSCSTQKIQINL